MFATIRAICISLLLAMLTVFYTGTRAIAQDEAWRVRKSSGDVWVTSSGVQQASVTNETILKPGDNIRTGQTGRVLLMRGEETILISSNSVVGISKDNKNAMSTTIVQQAGSILLDVEKRNIKHFEVDTPYLAAVVKGTQFRVTVGKYNSSVEVLRGQVDVTDFKSGQHALVLPDQTAKVSAEGSAGLSLSGSGILNPVEQGAPRVSSVMTLTEGSLLTPDSKLTAQPPQKVALQPDAKTVLGSFSGNVTSEGVWASGLSWAGKSLGLTDRWWTRSDDTVFAFGFPLAVGIFVSAAVVVQRRWQKRKPMPR
jgi:hypothetical protein